MNQQIHGHEVMKMMVESDQTYTEEKLIETLVQKFGREARFYTCSDTNMTAKELVEFLKSRGKFIEKGSGFSTSTEKICNH